MVNTAIVVHGGAINPLTPTFNQAMKESVSLGFRILQNGLALDAVTQVIRFLEDNPIFNAGTGSWPNLSGEIEMDAIIIDGTTQKSGAVCCIKQVKNPILVARKVMEETDHILLAGDGAVRFARSFGLDEYDPSTPERRKEWESMLDRISKGEQIEMFSYWKKIVNFMDSDTVGCVALDREGHICAGTSSGGFPLKLPGRVGDVPLFGCSTFADDEIGGVSLSGQGELVIQETMARKICEAIAGGQVPEEAMNGAVDLFNKKHNRALLGGIALNAKGQVGVARNTDLMPHAYMSDTIKEPLVGFAPKTV